MSEENPSNSVKKKVDTVYPDLWTVRNYKVGIFYEKREFKGLGLRKEEREPRLIKTLTHPLWLKEGQPAQLHIEESILQILRTDGTKATRHKGKRTKWITSLENNGQKGYHASHVRTPKGSKWVDSKIAKEGYNKIAGRKESGLAYKIRREFWRILSRNDNAAILLADDCAWIKKKKRDPGQVSVPLVDLSKAVQEMLSVSLFDNKGLVHNDNEEFVKKWYRALQSFFVGKLPDNQIMDYVNENQQDFIRIIAKKRWKAILAHLSEIEISNRTASKKSNNIDEFEYDIGKPIINSQLEPDGVYDLFFDDPEMLDAFLARLNDSTGECCGLMEDIDSVCEECGGIFKLQYRLLNLEVICNLCGLVSRKIDISEEEHFFATISNLDY